MVRKGRQNPLSQINMATKADSIPDRKQKLGNLKGRLAKYKLKNELVVKHCNLQSFICFLIDNFLISRHKEN
jgi:hypothetical protein